MIPLTPALVLWAANALKNLKGYWLILFLAAYMVDNGISQITDFVLKDDRKEWMNLEKKLDKIIPHEKKIVMSNGPNPTIFYYTNREGWLLNGEHLVNLKSLDSLQSVGASVYLHKQNQNPLDTNDLQKLKPLGLIGEFDIYSIKAK